MKRTYSQPDIFTPQWLSCKFFSIGNSTFAQAIPKLLLLFLLFSATSSITCIQAQDIHFSQLTSAPLNLSPAYFSNQEYDLRLVMNHKNQWNSFTNAYKTYSFSVDGPLRFLSSQVLSPGWGLIVNSDRAGDGGMGFISLQFPISILLPLRAIQSEMRMAIVPGLTQYSVQMNQLTFDSQYSGNSFQSDLPNLESNAANPIVHADWSVAAAIKTKLNEDFTFQLAGNFQHFNQPEFSFYGDGITKLPARIQTLVEFEWEINPSLKLSPLLYFSSQSKYKEWLLGTKLELFKENQTISRQWYGLYYRGLDAVVLSYHLQFSDYQIGFSYDINLSGLTPASYGRGGFEFSLIYWLSKKPTIPVTRFRHCPRYI